MTTTVKAAPTHRANLVKLVSGLIEYYSDLNSTADNYNHNYLSHCSVAFCINSGVFPGLDTKHFTIDEDARSVQVKSGKSDSLRNKVTHLFGADYWKRVVYMQAGETVYSMYEAGGRPQLKEVIKFIINRYNLSEFNSFLYDTPTTTDALPEGITAATIYKTDDGQEFKTVEAAVKYNRDTAFRKEMMQIIGGGINKRLYLDDVYDLNKFLLDNPKVREVIAKYHNEK